MKSAWACVWTNWMRQDSGVCTSNVDEPRFIQGAMDVCVCFCCYLYLSSQIGIPSEMSYMNFGKNLICF